MSELRSNTALLLVTLLFVSGISPLLLSAGAESEEVNEVLPYSAGGVVFVDIAYFDV